MKFYYIIDIINMTEYEIITSIYTIPLQGTFSLLNNDNATSQIRPITRRVRFSERVECFVYDYKYKQSIKYYVKKLYKIIVS
jgi:hypothetical protein